MQKPWNIYAFGGIFMLLMAFLDMFWAEKWALLFYFCSIMAFLGQNIAVQCAFD